MAKRKREATPESIFETEKKLKKSANVVLKEAKEIEENKIKNGYNWSKINNKTFVLKK
jgi:hypothetical protein